MKSRRCLEDRWDFTADDGPAFPIYVNRHGSTAGELYGFCPSKVIRDDPVTVQLFRMLMISAETGVMLKSGGMEDQPYWYLDLLGWIIPKLDLVKFAMKSQMILGSSSSGGADKTKQLFKEAQRTARGGNNRPTTR